MFPSAQKQSIWDFKSILVPRCLLPSRKFSWLQLSAISRMKIIHTIPKEEGVVKNICEREVFNVFLHPNVLTLFPALTCSNIFQKWMQISNRPRKKWLPSGLEPWGWPWWLSKLRLRLPWLQLRLRLPRVFAWLCPCDCAWLCPWEFSQNKNKMLSALNVQRFLKLSGPEDRSVEICTWFTLFSVAVALLRFFLPMPVAMAVLWFHFFFPVAVAVWSTLFSSKSKKHGTFHLHVTTGLS